MYEITYNPLWKTLVDMHWNKTDLQKKTGLSSATIAKIAKNESVTMDVVGRICEALQVPVYDVVEVLTTTSPQKDGSQSNP